MKFLPRTKLGKRSLILIICFFLFLIIAHILIATGQEGGETFLDNLYISVPMLLAALSALSAFVTGIISIIKKERAILVYLSTLIGFLILIFLIGEFIFPH